ncbi:MAG: hypothetical protein IJI16_06120 [Atopobiaceae bacterium]|nr:hypothetical protein [Atopobiaceae bacterium]
MADTGTITFSTALDNGQLEKDIKQAEKEVDDLKRKLEKSESDKNVIADKLEEAREEVSKTEAELVKLGERLNELDEMAEKDPVGASARAEAVTEEFVQQAKLYEEQTKKASTLEGKWKDLDAQTKRYSADLQVASQRQAELGTEYARSMRGENLTAGLKEATSRMDAFSNRITKMAKKVFVFTLIAKGLRTIKSYLGEAMAENEQFQASWGNLKATIQGVANFVASSLAPVLSGFINMVAAMITTLAQMVDSIFKTNIAEAIARAKAAAQATGQQAKATKRLTKATKEASKELMAFDEINAMSAEISEDAADSLDDQADAGSVGLDWDAFDVGKIDEKLAEIMIIVGAALLAVGAVLAFSGINIPLGLTLMVIGALMIYTAYQEQWDKLPQEVKDAINTALVITGIVLLVIGAVLAFSGVSIPMGIGLMLAGIALLYTAAALNWKDLPDEVKATITTIMVILGGALLVIGAVLAFSGINIPLGIGLMLAGAASLAAAAALNWDELPDNIRETITTVLLIVGAALIVIGVILICTGVGIPLGIGCILAGVASLVGAAAINWDFLKDKVKEIWEGIVRFWDQNIAPIFTWEWWENLFKSIVNGLIWAINTGLDAFGGFINDIAGGIGGILEFFGIEGWDFHLTMPQIPYLAEGAVIPPNRKFMAVLGDQTNGQNLEAPEGLIRQIVREESGGGAEMMSVLYMMLDAIRDGSTIYVDKQVLGRVAGQEIASMARMSGV